MPEHPEANRPHLSAASSREILKLLSNSLLPKQNIVSFIFKTFYYFQRASHNGGQQDKTEDLIGSFHPEASGDQHVQSYVSERLEDLEHRLETFLEQMTEEMTQEVEREQQHLMLMQNQVMISPFRHCTFRHSRQYVAHSV